MEENGLMERVEADFLAGLSRQLGGLVLERRVITNGGRNPTLFYLVGENNLGVKITIRIPLGGARPEHHTYLAIINGSQPQLFNSPRAIGNQAAEAFRRDYARAAINL